MIELGETVRDNISNFEGVAVQRVKYLGAPDRIGVQPKTNDNSLPQLEYFLESHLKAVSSDKKIGFVNEGDK